jgi:hypothetical protein
MPKQALSTSGDLKLVLQPTTNGISLLSLYDLAAQRELLAPASLPLFTLKLRRIASNDERTLSADAGWRQVAIHSHADRVSLAWDRPEDDSLFGIHVSATATPDSQHHAWRWTLQVQNSSPDWTTWRVVFPQLALRKPGDDAVALVPAGPGQLKPDAWDVPFRQECKYPGGWYWGLQFMAAYASAPTPSGLYVAMHDPHGATKDITMASDPQAGALQMIFDHAAPDMGHPGNAFTLSGEAVWQLLRGDWFDAAMIYKDWARQHALWWPRLGEDGRPDTPLWMRELCLWASGGSSHDMTGHPTLEATTDAVRQLQAFVGLPLGFHWYCWHQIPFDNDYPHYFPALPGFPEAVRELQRSDVHVMPYINGRLWDTRDRGTEDFEFSRVALPAATKDETGAPYTETYGSLEADGTPVRLAPMCPTTDLWQARVRDLVARLFSECGVDGVYIDQVAAAAAVLCMDPTHGHPLGGGHWWNDGYWQMIEAIRAAMPAERMITTECNAESFLHCFDGYLTWHWQQDNMVPVFPAVYGGAIQMFGRNYGGTAGMDEPTQALAWRMRAGQQFIYGEQLGWFNMRLVNEALPMGFIRQLARLRWRLRRYFYAGEMARPPKLEGHIPRLRANWEWYAAGDTPWVTTDALMCGAWRMRRENCLVLLFANVSDEPIETTVRWNAADYGIVTSAATGTLLDDEREILSYSLPDRYEGAWTFPAQKALALRVQWLP